MKPPPGYRARTSASERVWLREGSEAFLEASGLSSVSAALALPGEQRGRVKSLVVLGEPGSRVFVKRWHFDRVEVALRATLKLNFPTFDGLAELANLEALRAAGFRVPAPLAAGSTLQGRQRESFVALAELAGEPLSTFRGAPRQLARELGQLVRRLHQAGFAHRDLYLANVFHDPDLGLGFLDCERVFRNAGPPRWRWRVKDLAALLASASPAWSRSDRLRVLLAYCGVQRQNRDVRRLARAVARKARRIRAHGVKGPDAS